MGEFMDFLSDAKSSMIEDDSANSISVSASSISNHVDKNGWYYYAASINRETNRGNIMAGGRALNDVDISSVTGPIGNSNEIFFGQSGVSSNRVYGPIAYIRYSIGIARGVDEMRYNALNFNSRANGIVQDLLVQ